ncbi:MAG: GWxTD domain-containing protein [Ignavibacteria bacterium]|nr:GWxTD domain-containing protein [Ignavibacteria bacterium]
MRAIITFVFSALLFLGAFSSSHSQNLKKTKTKADLFYLDVLNFYSSEGTRSRVDVYVEIPLKNMEFKRSKTDKSNYVSKFDLNIDVIDKDNNVIYNNLSKEEVTTKETGQEYLSQNSQILTRNLFLPPGDYNVKVSIYEQSTKKRFEKDKKIVVEDYSTLPLSISDVMIVSRLSSNEGKKTITPDVERNVGIVDTFYLFYYVYKNNDDQKVDVNCRIIDSENKEVYVKKETIDFTTGLAFQNQVFMAVPTTDFGYGKYTIEISAASNNYNAEANSTFQNLSPDFPAPLKDIDMLVEQLQYIAKDDEMSFMRDGKDNTEKQKRFLDFWKKKDPSPNSKRNEVMQEYYRRLMTADKFFSTTYTPGWKTDMGMVFIIFGEPSNIERHPYDMDQKPYEIWDYYEDSKQFVFIDNTGFGDYRLITPIWDTFRFSK